MAALRSEPFSINGYWWRDVTNETTCGVTYSLRDVINAGGKTPTMISVCSSDYPSVNKKQEAKSKFIPKRKEK